VAYLCPRAFGLKHLAAPEFWTFKKVSIIRDDARSVPLLTRLPSLGRFHWRHHRHVVQGYEIEAQHSRRVRAVDCYVLAPALGGFTLLAGTLAVPRRPKVSPAPSSATGVTSRCRRTCNLAHLTIPLAHLTIPLAHLTIPLAHLTIPLAHLTIPVSDSVVIEDESGRILLKGAAVRSPDRCAPVPITVTLSFCR
jgi:hypothetical protein